jgi:hypothetical protein
MPGLCLCGLCKCSSVGSSVLHCPVQFWDHYVWRSVPNLKQHNIVLFMKYLQSAKFPILNLSDVFVPGSVTCMWTFIVCHKLVAVECTCEACKERLKVYWRSHEIQSIISNYLLHTFCPSCCVNRWREDNDLFLGTRSVLVRLETPS